MRRSGTVLTAFALVSLFGCVQRKEEPPAQPAPAASPAEQTPPAAPASSRPASGRPVKAPAAHAAPAKSGSAPQEPAPPAAATEPAAPKRPTTVVIPEGTTLQVRLTQPLSTAKNRQGERFEAVLDTDLEIDGQVVVPRGSTIAGRLTEVDPSGRVKGRARMTLTLSDVVVGGESYPIHTNALSLEADATKGRDTAKVGGGAALGAIIGAIAGGGKGAAIGAAAGAGAGAATVLVTKGKDLELQPEQRFAFRLDQELRVRTGGFEAQAAAGQAAGGEDQGAGAQARVERKAKKLEAALPNWVRNGGDPKAAQDLMGEVSRLLQAGRLRDAEAKIDQGLAMVGSR